MPEPTACAQKSQPSLIAPHPFVTKKGKRKVQGVPQSQAASLPRHQEEEEADKTKQAEIEQTYEKKLISSLFPKSRVERKTMVTQTYF